MIGVLQYQARYGAANVVPTSDVMFLQERGSGAAPKGPGPTRRPVSVAVASGEPTGLVDTRSGALRWSRQRSLT